MVSVSLYAAEASDRENVFSERFTLVGNQMKTVVVEALKSIISLFPFRIIAKFYLLFQVMFYWRIDR